MSLSTRSNKRFEGTITVDPKYMGKLIGSGGCNIRRITSEVRAGCYIRGKDDTFTISAWTSQAVKKAAEMLKRDYAALIDPSKRPSKPFALLTFEPAIVPHIVGRGGEGLRTIMNKVGDGCYIVHRDGAFHISANSNKDLRFAKKLIFDAKKQFQALVESPKEQSQSTNPTGKYDALAFSSDDDDNDDDEDDDEEVNDFSSPTQPPPFTKASFPELPGTKDSGNVQLEITGKSWKPNLAHSDTPVTVATHVLEARKQRDQVEIPKQCDDVDIPKQCDDVDIRDQCAKYNSLYLATQKKIDLLQNTPSQDDFLTHILAKKAQGYKDEAHRLQRIIDRRDQTFQQPQRSWADMCDDSDSDNDDEY